MDFALSDEERLFKDEVRRFVEQEIAPNVDAWEEEERFPKPIFARAGDLGDHPAGTGGYGGSAVMEAILIEEIARVAPTVAAAFAAPLIISPLVRAAGTHEQWERFGLPIAQGRLVVSQAFTEPDAGSDLTSITTTAVREDGGYVIRGAKMFTSQSPFSDCVLVLAYLDRSAGAEGMALFIVDRTTPASGSRLRSRPGRCGTWRRRP